MRYPVVLHTDDGIRYGVTVPDLLGCFSAGDTLDEARDMEKRVPDFWPLRHAQPCANRG